jgi:hypothetical protein
MYETRYVREIHVNAEFATLKCCQVTACPGAREAETFLQRGNRREGTGTFAAAVRECRISTDASSAASGQCGSPLTL